MSKYRVIGIVAMLVTFIVGIGVGFWADSGSDRVQVQEKEVIVEVEPDEPNFSPVKAASDACVKQGGVPTFSAWDGGVNGCITPEAKK